MVFFRHGGGGYLDETKFLQLELLVVRPQDLYRFAIGRRTGWEEKRRGTEDT